MGYLLCHLFPSAFTLTSSKLHRRAFQLFDHVVVLLYQLAYFVVEAPVQLLIGFVQSNLLELVDNPAHILADVIRQYKSQYNAQ